MLETFQQLLSPLDLAFAATTFLGGIAAAWRIFKKNPMRNASIFLQVALLIIKMANHYVSSHPEAKEKLNRKIELLLQDICRKLDLYVNEKKAIEKGQPLG